MREIINAPRHQVGLLQAELGKFHRPALVIEPERLGEHLGSRRGFRRRNQGSPDANALFPRARQDELQVVPIRGVAVDAEAVGVRVELDQFGDQAVHIHAGIGLARRVAVSGPRSDDRPRALGPRILLSGARGDAAGQRRKE